MSDKSVEDVLHADDGVQSMASVYAAIQDWISNVPLTEGRVCERLDNIRDRGLVPTAQRYCEYVAVENGYDFTGDAEALLQDWAGEFRPDYVAAADEHEWDSYGRGLTRALLDPECRIARVAVNRSIDVNDVTINICDTDVMPEPLQDEFAALWRDWFRRLDDLYWNRRTHLYKDIVKAMEGGFIDGEDKQWERYKSRYPKLPYQTIIGGEKCGVNGQ
jgi:hypothetical protein